MTSYRNKYLEMLKTDFGKKPLPEEPPKLTNFGKVALTQTIALATFPIARPQLHTTAVSFFSSQ